jgi:alanine racemase
VLVLAGIYPEQLEDLVQNGLVPVMVDGEALGKLEERARRRGVSIEFHLKVDTGMGRVGLLASEMDSWLPELAKLEALKMVGVLSHFSQAESVAGDYTRGQLKLFEQVVKKVSSAARGPLLAHIANSAAVIALPAAHLGMVRPGLMLYGIHPAPEMKDEVELKPVLSWRTRILQLKRVPAGFSVSYGRTFVTRRESLIATIPVGYADGFRRELSNRALVLVRGLRAPVVGRVCMDLTLVDVTDVPGVCSGDEVVLLGKQGSETISADEMARWADTIPYEILTSIGARVPRVYVNDESVH